MSKAVYRSTSYNNSGALISGIPTLIAFYNDYIDNIEKHVVDATETVLKKYKKSIVEDAQTKGWGDLSSTVDVSFDPEKLEISVAGDTSMEYGLGTEPPRPVIRAAISRTEDLTELITAELKKRML